MKPEYQVQRKFSMPSGGSVTVTYSSSEPINPEDHMLLKSPTAAQEMGRCLMDLANAMRPPKCSA